VLIYSVLFAALLFVLVRYSRFFRTDGLPPWTLSIAFLLKLCAGLVLFWVHIRTYGIGELSHDGERFLNEGHLLQDVYYKSPWDYLRLLTGIGETEALTQHYLSTTRYWSAGDLTIINDAKNVIRIHSLMHFISFNSVYVHLAAFCLLSTAALRNLYLAFKESTRYSNRVLFWILLLVPSTIFWTSSMMKEPFMFFGTTLFLRALLVESNLVKKYFWFVFSSFILLAFKPYILLCLIFSVLCVTIYKYIFKERLLNFIIFIILSIPIFSYIFPDKQDSIVHYLTRKQFDFVNVGKGGVHVQTDTCFYFFQSHQYSSIQFEGYTAELKQEAVAYRYRFGSTQRPVPVKLEPNGEKWTVIYKALGSASYIETTPINESFTQLLRNIPEAFFNAGIRPLPNDPGSKLKYLSMLEVWLLFAFLSYAVFKRRTLASKDKNLILGLVFFSLFLTVLIGWTTPVLGAITRYRFPAQLALVLVGLILIQPTYFTKWKKQSL
jgi:hypothetical protein